MLCFMQAGLTRMQRWLETLSANTQKVRKKDFEQFEGVWSGGQVLHHLQSCWLEAIWSTVHW
jgi:hypothetical protein